LAFENSIIVDTSVLPGSILADSPRFLLTADTVTDAVYSI
jgi:hypothetical protein